MSKQIIVKEVTSPRQIKNFIRYPKQLYKKCPHYVPSLESDDYASLTNHPALSFCTLRLWMAYKENRVAGRIAGIINHRCNELKNQKRIRFGWFDVEEDFSVAEALFEKIEEWAKEEGLKEICGPSRFSNMEKQGVLIEGFHETPPISSEYNYAYYPVFIEKLGYTKEHDYFQYRGDIKEIPPKIKRLNETILQRYNVKIKEFKTKEDLKRYARDFFLALNESFADIHNFIPLTEPEIDYLIKGNFSVARKELVCILVDETDKVIGFGFCLPSLSKAFQKANGKLFPFGWYHITKALKKNDTVDLYLTGVLPGWVHRGIHAIYHNKLHEVFLELGYKQAVTNQELEDNIVNRVWKKYDADPIFRRRCYVKEI